MKIAFIILALILVAVPATLWFSSGSTVVDAKPGVFGAETPLAVQVSNLHGVRKIQATLVQENRQSTTATEFPATRIFFSKNEPPRTETLKVTAQPDQGFKTGPAKLTIEATSNDFRGKTDSKAYEVKIDLRPPAISADGFQHYINQAGAELVTFQISGYWTEAGVKVGKYTFRSYPLPGTNEPNSRFSLFAYPWDLPPDVVPMVYAKGAGGQEVTTQFWFKLFPKAYRKRDLDLDDRFLQKATGELDPGGTGDLLPRFLKINREMRKANNETLAGLALKTEARQLWQPPFQQLSNSKVEAQFADVRTYKYKGEKVDEQVHLGFDLSVTANVPVVASNSGKVVWADRLGIYGNCVVVDHGYGLQSIYAHMSQIEVKPGQSVERQQVLGKSGATGLAGGDHLHYSMQLDGVQINPVEWWDPHWIQDRVLSKLNPPASSGAAPAEMKQKEIKSVSRPSRRRRR